MFHRRSQSDADARVLDPRRPISVFGFWSIRSCSAQVGISGVSLKFSLTLHFFVHGKQVWSMAPGRDPGELVAMSWTRGTLDSASFEVVATVGAKSTSLLVSTSARSVSDRLRHDRRLLSPIFTVGCAGARVCACEASPPSNFHKRVRARYSRKLRF